MKNFFKALGKALLYFAVFFGVQGFVSFIFGTVLGTVMMFKENLDTLSPMQLTEFFQAEILKYTSLILLISNALLMVVIWLIFVVRRKNLLREIEFNRCCPRRCVFAVIFGVAFSMVISLGVGFIPFPESMIDSFTQNHESLSLGNPIVNFISVGIITPIAEECFFRGLMYTRLKQGMNLYVAAAISSFIFALMHGEAIWIITAFMMGLMLVLVFEKTGSLVPCVIIHVVNNVISLLTMDVQASSDAVYLIIFVAAVVICATFAVLLLNKKEEPL